MKRFVPVILALAVGLMVVAPAAGSTDIHLKKGPKAHVSKTNLQFSKTKAQASTTKAQTSKKKKCKRGWKWSKKKKKCVKKKPAYVPPPPPPPPPAPLALTDSEVRSQVNQKAFEYCLPDPYCYDWGIYVEYLGGPIACSSKSTYSWSCYGWNDEYYLGYFFTCDFREIVDRVGYNGITSHQNPTFGSNGWDCY